MPLNGGFGSIDADIKIILVSIGNLGSVNDSLHATFETDKAISIIIQFTARNKGGQLGRKFIDFQPRNVTGEIMSMRSNIPHAIRCASNLGIGAPVRDGTRAFPFDISHRVTLRIFHDNLEYASQFLFIKHALGFLNHRITGVVMSQRKNEI